MLMKLEQFKKQSQLYNYWIVLLLGYERMGSLFFPHSRLFTGICFNGAGPDRKELNNSKKIMQAMREDVANCSLAFQQICVHSLTLWKERTGKHEGVEA